ncbi:ParB/RepB/Spo0J family partition protein [Desulfonatronum thiodismutans]|uniref:ParB/RepB/Spo0J family partition protein n=1 Tax=Desulfonatronum thiodismutans TaxID=159290 RepID=UPI0009FE99E9|nr:ParB/RepB/Spo0J family partition protein [Desulfonatronum thiodismutans]
MAGWIRVYASQLDCSGASLFWAGSPPDELCRSIREVGQLDPVLIRAHDEGYKLLSGYRRAAFLAQEHREITARCLPGPGSPLEDGLLYLHANTHRPLDEPMRVQALRYFQPLLEPEELTRCVAPLLGVPPRSGIWRKYLAWIELPVFWDDLLRVGNVPLAAGTILARLRQDELEALRPYFEAWKWSQGRAVQWLTLLQETVLGRGWSLVQTLEAVDGRRVLESGLAPQDALQALTTQAKALRYPQLDGMGYRFGDLAKRLFGSSRWEIIPSPNFESDAVELRLRARSVEDLRAAARALNEATAPESPLGCLKGLFQIAQDEQSEP